MARATNAEDFRKKVESSIQSLGLELVELEDAEIFTKRDRADIVFDEQIYEIKDRIEHGEVVAFGTFYKWTYDDASQ
jgi:hypothetical protein